MFEVDQSGIWEIELSLSDRIFNNCNIEDELKPGSIETITDDGYSIIKFVIEKGS